MAEQNLKERELLRKAEGLETALVKMHEQHVQSVKAIEEELQEYQQQSSEFKSEIATLGFKEDEIIEKLDIEV